MQEVLYLIPKRINEENLINLLHLFNCICQFNEKTKSETEVILKSFQEILLKVKKMMVQKKLLE